MLRLVAENTGVPLGLIDVAVRYWADYPGEVDAEVSAGNAAEEQLEASWRRRQELLRRRA